MVASQIWPLLDAGADQLVLGCTHFPFLLPWIDQAIALWRANTGIVRAIGVIDPAPAVARQAVRVERAGIARLDSDVFWTTGDPLAFCRGARDTLGLEWKGAAARKAHPDDRGHDPI